MREEEFRKKVTWFSFAFSMLVIWAHSYNAQLYLGETAEAARLNRIQHWIGDGLGQIAVPGFFMISGYLFFRDFQWEKLEGKWKRRVHSVLIPFLFWNFLYYIGYVIGSRLPWMGQVVGKGIVPFHFAEFLKAVVHYHYNPVFWYLYQLIGLIALAPVLYLILRRCWSSVLFFVGVWAAIIWNVRLPYLNADALLYYGTAAFLALHEHTKRMWVEAEASWKNRWIGLSFLIASVVSYWSGLSKAWVPCFVLTRLLAVGGSWLLVSSSWLKTPGEWVQHNFFLYAIHFAWVRLINKCGAELFSGIVWIPMVLYGIMPVLVAAIAAGIGAILRKKTPVLWKMLTGNR